MYDNSVHALPIWLSPTFVREQDIKDRARSARRLNGPLGRKYAASVAYDLTMLSHELYPSPTIDDFVERHPFLYRPLLEFVLRLPPTMRCQPYAAKFIAREALRGILPEPVRLRTGKGGTGARMIWGIEREFERIMPWLRQPVLADLGCIDPKRLRQAVRKARRGKVNSTVALLETLALESWLRIRSNQNSTKLEPAAPQLRAVS